MSATITRVRVSGMKCGGCEAAARDAVARLPGYENAEFDHTSGSGVVYGDVDLQAVLSALAAAGYPAQPAS